MMAQVRWKSFSGTSHVSHDVLDTSRTCESAIPAPLGSVSVTVFAEALTVRFRALAELLHDLVSAADVPALQAVQAPVGPPTLPLDIELQTPVGCGGV